MIFDKKHFNRVFEKEGWGYSTSEYEQVKYARQLEAIKKWSPQPERILEIGCAEGLFTSMLAEAFPNARILGLDFSNLAMTKARENCTCRNIELLEADIIETFRQRKLPGKFDVIVQSESLYYLFPRLLTQWFLFGYFRQLSGALKASGIFLTTNGISSVTRYLMELYYTIIKRDCHPVHSAQYTEWNEFRNKQFTYDLKVFRHD